MTLRDDLLHDIDAIRETLHLAIEFDTKTCTSGNAASIAAYAQAILYLVNARATSRDVRRHLCPKLDEDPPTPST